LKRARRRFYLNFEKFSAKNFLMAFSDWQVQRH
jgi:hypothetical protein